MPKSLFSRVSSLLESQNFKKQGALLDSIRQARITYFAKNAVLAAAVDSTRPKL